MTRRSKSKTKRKNSKKKDTPVPKEETNTEMKKMANKWTFWGFVLGLWPISYLLRKWYGDTKTLLPVSNRDVEENVSDLKAKITDKDKDLEKLRSTTIEQQQAIEDGNIMIKDLQTSLDQQAQQNVRLNARIKDLETDKRRLDIEKQTMNSRIEHIGTELHEKKQEVVEIRKQRQEAEAEKQDALRRLSQLVSVKLRDNNPNIVDLNDQFRPTKLAEMFSELYDNEWTGAYTAMEDTFKDRQMIDFLLDVVLESYYFCAKELEGTWSVVSKWYLDKDLPNAQQTRKALKDGRKIIVPRLAAEVEQRYSDHLLKMCNDSKLESVLSAKDVKDYVALCVKLSLLMNANDPPVVIECPGWVPCGERQAQETTMEANDVDQPDALDETQADTNKTDGQDEEDAATQNQTENVEHQNRDQDSTSKDDNDPFNENENESTETETTAPRQEVTHENKAPVFDNELDQADEPTKIQDKENVEVKQRIEFDKDRFKEYTARGRYLEFYVWPIMYLHKDGPMLGKGIGQGSKVEAVAPSDKTWVWYKT